MANPCDQMLADVLQGRRPVVWRTANGEWLPHPPIRPVGLLSGSFNPLHVGHEDLRRAAELRLKGPVGFELPIINAEKPPLDITSVEQRVAQFADATIAVTTAATFVEKARLVNAVTFIVGFDTAERILHPRFYDSDETAMHAALGEIQSAECCFLVAGRSVGGTFCGVSDLAIPTRFRDLFTGLTEDEFRSDISSTAIRRR